MVSRGQAPAAAPMAARKSNVFHPVDPIGAFPAHRRSVLYPTAADAQDSFPGATITALQFPLHDGEFFDVGVSGEGRYDFTSGVPTPTTLMRSTP